MSPVAEFDFIIVGQAAQAACSPIGSAPTLIAVCS